MKWFNEPAYLPFTQIYMINKKATETYFADVHIKHREREYKNNIPLLSNEFPVQIITIRHETSRSWWITASSAALRSRNRLWRYTKHGSYFDLHKQPRHKSSVTCFLLFTTNPWKFYRIIPNQRQRNQHLSSPSNTHSLNVNLPPVAITYC